MQDPLSSIPHQTFQAHRANRAALPSPHPSLPANPTITAPSSATAPRNPTAAELAATVFAAPQLRDLKKEATAFTPSSLKRKKAGGIVATGSSKINAAPTLGPSPDDSQSEPTPGQARPDLLSTLKDQFGTAPAASVSTSSRGPSGNKTVPNEGPKGKDDYAKFVEELDDILGPSSS
jgi:hypothetical protein